jgi:hypothetical protein
MKKILLLLAVILSSSALFSQSSITTFWEFGPTFFSPVITFNGAPDDEEIISYITVQNAGEEAVTVKVARENVNLIGDSRNQFCWGDICFGWETDTSGTEVTLAPGEAYVGFSGHYDAVGAVGISFVKYTFYDVNNPNNKSEVMVSYNNLFEISCEDGDSVSKHTRMLNGYNDEEIMGTIKVHNHVSADLNLIAFRQLVPGAIVAGSTNSMSFGGVDYPETVDTTGMVTVGGNTTDESFMMHYNGNGSDGVSQVIYVFSDITNTSNFALYWIHFNAEGESDISEAILANTSFSAAYPNPASNHVSFDYDIPQEVKMAELMITNLVGAVVYESSIEGNIGTKRIDVSNLTEGIYFATLKLDNEVAKSQKILVQ